MNEIIRQMFDRKSVRAFEDTPVSPEQKKAILEAACQAPTAGNQQLYSIIDVTDQEVKEQLAELCDHQAFIAKAPLVLVFVADQQKWLDLYDACDCNARRPEAGDIMLAVTDTCIAAENAVNAAWSLGIGSCYIGDVMEQCESMRELLSLPPYVFPCAMLVLGFPTEQQKKREKPGRCPLDTIVMENRYERREKEGLACTFGWKAGELSLEEWTKRFCNRKYNSDFSKEMSRSVRAYLEAYHRP